MFAYIVFSFCRMTQKSIHQSDPEYFDGRYVHRVGMGLPIVNRETVEESKEVIAGRVLLRKRTLAW